MRSDVELRFMFAKLHSRSLQGINAIAINVEVHVSGGLPNIRIVGLPETEVRESADRVRSAIQNSKFQFPPSRVTINLAPANFPKQGGRYDLPIALGVLVAYEKINGDKTDQYEFAGELALDGKLRSCGGALPMVLAASKDERTFVLPPDDAAIGTLSGHKVLQAETLLDVCAFLNGQKDLPPATPIEPTPRDRHNLCMSDVRGQIKPKGALRVAAAGGHSVLMVGPPGSGKSMMAQRFVDLMPPLDEGEALKSASVRSLAATTFDPHTWKQRPFRSPHHTTSAVALIGGGSRPRPGEISLAHHGVLFLDELPEFQRPVLEALREPLESGTVTISRAAQQAEFPAHFQLIAAMNPCPCGYHGHPQKPCHCTPTQIYRYRSKISGPILDRIDLHIEVHGVKKDDLEKSDHSAGEPTETICKEVTNARQFQLERQGTLNAHLPTADIGKYCSPDEAGAERLKNAMQRFSLSARAYHRILKIARTIADLYQIADISEEHIKTAIQYRRVSFAMPGG